MRRWHPRTSHRDSIIALFGEAADNAAHASALLETLLKQWWARREIAHEIRCLEHNGDRIAHDLFRYVQLSLTLPFDREDADGLASALDDGLGYVGEAAEHVVIYKVGSAPEHVIALAGLIRQSTRELAVEVRLLARPARLGKGVKPVDALEVEADRTLRAARSALFSHETDPSLVLRWKDILERLESAVGSCNQAARALETISVKNGG